MIFNSVKIELSLKTSLGSTGDLNERNENKQYFTGNDILKIRNFVYTLKNNHLNSVLLFSDRNKIHQYYILKFTHEF